MKIDNLEFEGFGDYSMITCDLHVVDEIYQCAEHYDPETDVLCDGSDPDAHMSVNGIVNRRTGKTVYFTLDGDEDGDGLYEHVRERVLKSMRRFVDHWNSMKHVA